MFATDPGLRPSAVAIWLRLRPDLCAAVSILTSGADHGLISAGFFLGLFPRFDLLFILSILLLSYIMLLGVSPSMLPR